MYIYLPKWIYIDGHGVVIPKRKKGRHEDEREEERGSEVEEFPADTASSPSA